MCKRSLSQWLVISFLATLTAACGGGGGGGSTPDNTTQTATPSASPTPATTTTTTTTPTPTQTASVNHPVHVAWSMPTTRADGSALTAGEISGYRLFYTRDGSSTSEDTIIPISGSTTTSIDLSLTNVGIYTFAVTAIDSNGAESALSSTVSITVN